MKKEEVVQSLVLAVIEAHLHFPHPIRLSANAICSRIPRRRATVLSAISSLLQRGELAMTPAGGLYRTTHSYPAGEVGKDPLLESLSRIATALAVLQEEVEGLRRHAQKQT